MAQWSAQPTSTFTRTSSRSPFLLSNCRWAQTCPTSTAWLQQRSTTCRVLRARKVRTYKVRTCKVRTCNAHVQAADAQAASQAQALAMQAAMQASMQGKQSPFMQAFQQQFAFAPHAMPVMPIQGAWPGMCFALPPGATPAACPGQPSSSSSTSRVHN
eukprot:4465376-Pleurochrysis_carterae.AAC.1